MKCCLCGKNIEVKGTWKKGNNAWPVKDGRCCNDCDITRVIPARLKGLKKCQGGKTNGKI